MQSYNDTYRKKQAQIIRARQLEGWLVAVDDYCADQFPLPVVNGIARAGKYGGYETDAGSCFSGRQRPYREPCPRLPIASSDASFPQRSGGIVREKAFR